jgi:hypothetical protein
MRINPGDPYQRRAYANRRFGLALERVKKARKKAEKERAGRWSAAWWWATGIRPFNLDAEPADNSSI